MLHEMQLLFVCFYELRFMANMKLPCDRYKLLVVDFPNLLRLAYKKFGRLAFYLDQYQSAPPSSSQSVIWALISIVGLSLVGH